MKHITLRDDQIAFHRIVMQPRVLVTVIDAATMSGGTALSLVFGPAQGYGAIVDKGEQLCKASLMQIGVLPTFAGCFVGFGALLALTFVPFVFSGMFDTNGSHEVEVQHVRVCMLSMVGFVATQYFVSLGHARECNGAHAMGVPWVDVILWRLFRLRSCSRGLWFELARNFVTGASLEFA